jgi:hypothetical protein
MAVINTQRPTVPVWLQSGQRFLGFAAPAQNAVISNPCSQFILSSLRAVLTYKAFME